MLKLNRPTLAGLLATLGVCALAPSAAAQATPNGAVILNTAQLLLKEAANGPATRPVGKDTGSGVADTEVAFDNATGDIFAVYTESVTPNGQTGMQGGMALAKLTATGLSATKVIDLPELNGERTHMRAQPAIGKNFLLDIFASEDNGVNNGNPESVAWVFDRTGQMLTITNTTRGTAGKPTNLIELGLNGSDGQQWGPHSICPLGADATGAESFIVGMQRNNQSAWVAKVTVQADGAGGATVNVPYLKKILNNAQHNRVQLACPNTGIAGSTIVATTVEANDQPADIGIRAILVDTTSGRVIQSKLIAPSDPNNNMYAVQPSVAYISDSVVAIGWQASAAVRPGGNNNGNGHGHGENVSYLTTLRVSTDPTTAFQQLDQANRVAPYQRHANSYGALFGPGAGSPAVAVVGGSSTGTGKGLVQMIPVDGTTGKIGAIDPMKMYEVSSFSDVANLPARGKRNPNNQGRGFLHAKFGLKNPGYVPGGQGNTFMPEVQSFHVAAVAGYKDMTTSNRDSLFITLIPATWDSTVQNNGGTTPGGVVNAGDIPPGPSQRAGGNTPATNPNGPTTASGSGSGGSSDPFGPASGGSSDGTQHAAGYGDTPQSAGGCSVSTTNTSSSTGLAGLAMMVGAALLSFRRRNNKKES